MAAPQKSSPRTSIRSGFHTLAPGTGEADGSLRLREKLFLIQNAMGGVERKVNTTSARRKKRLMKAEEKCDYVPIAEKGSRTFDKVSENLTTGPVRQTNVRIVRKVNAIQ